MKPFTGALLNTDIVPVSDISFPPIPVDQVVSNETALKLPIDNQYQLPICVADDIARQMQEYWLEKTGILLDFSRRWIYAKAVRDGLQGLYPADAYAVVCTVGCPTIATCPDRVTLTEQDYRDLLITPEMTQEASQYVMPAPISIPPDLQSIRSALPNVGAIGATFEVGDFSNEILQPPQTAYTALHRMSFGRIAPTYFGGSTTVPNDFIGEIPNSWGTFWGDYGIGFVFFSIWNGHIHDLFAFPKPIKTTMDTQTTQNPKLESWCKAAQEYEGWCENPPSRSYSNNNPGNLEFNGQVNAKLETGHTPNRFAHFNTYTDGFEALYNLFLRACSGQSRIYNPTMTLLDFYNVYAPSSDGNDVNAYATYIANALGVPVDTQICTFVQ